MSLNLHKIATTTVSSPVSTIDFTSIPQTYSDLIVKVDATGTGSVILSFNNSSTGYTFKVLRGTGALAQGLNNADYAGTTAWILMANSCPSNSEAYIPNYTSANYKSVQSDGVHETNATTAYATLTAGLWSNTAAITSLTVSAYQTTLNANTTATLYGVL